MDKQQTFGIIKPNATELKLEEKIMNDIQASGLVIVEKREMVMTRSLAKEFYAEHSGKDFFDDLINFMTSGKVIAMKIEGHDAVTKYRKLMGNTDPLQADEGTLRKKYGELKSRNSVHGSDSLVSAERELSLFF